MFSCKFLLLTWHYSGLPRRIRKRDSVFTFKHLPAEECLGIVRKTTLEIMRRFVIPIHSLKMFTEFFVRFKDAERDRSELYIQVEQLGREVHEVRKDHASMDIALSHSQEISLIITLLLLKHFLMGDYLCAILQDRVHHLQEEEVPVQNLRAEELKGSLHEQTERVAVLHENLQQMKHEMKSKDNIIDDIRADLYAREALLDSLRIDLESKDTLLSTFKREMAAKDALLANLKVFLQLFSHSSINTVVG